MTRSDRLGWSFLAAMAVATTSAFAEVAIIKLFLVGFIKDMDMVY